MFKFFNSGVRYFADPQDPGTPDQEPEQGTDEWYDWAVKKRGAKNVMKELEKTRADKDKTKQERDEAQKRADALESKIRDNSVKTPTKLASLVEKYKAERLKLDHDEEDINRDVNFFMELADVKADSKLEPLKGDAHYNSLMRITAKFEEDEKFKYPMSKLKKDFVKKMQDEIDPAAWGNEIVATKQLKELIYDHPEIFEDGDKGGAKKKPPQEPDNPSKASNEDGGASDDEIRKYADARGLASDTPEQRKLVKQAMAAQKRAEEALNKKE
jgi:hypothetical protein